MRDLVGNSIWDYFYNNNLDNLLVKTSIFESDLFEVEYFFRDFKEMNIIEQEALDLSEGLVLDVGSAAGSHSLYLQNEKRLEVTALDISPKAVEICKARGVKNAICCDFMNLTKSKYDTILLLMNGTGIFESLAKIDSYLKKIYSLLNDNGQVLVDGTDILYVYEEGMNRGLELPANHYYGEVECTIFYKGYFGEPFNWLYLDFDTLKKYAVNNGFQIENIIQDKHSYLARLIKIKA